MFFTAPVKMVSTCVFTFGTLMITSASTTGWATVKEMPFTVNGFEPDFSRLTRGIPSSWHTFRTPVFSHMASSLVTFEGLSPTDGLPPASLTLRTTARRTSGGVVTACSGVRAVSRFGLISTCWSGLTKAPIPPMRESSGSRAAATEPGS